MCINVYVCSTIIVQSCQNRAGICGLILYMYACTQQYKGRVSFYLLIRAHSHMYVRTYLPSIRRKSNISPITYRGKRRKRMKTQMKRRERSGKENNFHIQYIQYFVDAMKELRRGNWGKCEERSREQGKKERKKERLLLHKRFSLPMSSSLGDVMTRVPRPGC